MGNIIVILSIICNIFCGQYENIKTVNINEIVNTIEEQVNENQFNQEMKFILHAGGVTPEGIIGSNSIEALENSYAQGYRIMEIDLCWTKDNQLVCVHDWNSYYAPRFGKDSLTLQEFSKVKGSYYGYTSMTLDDLIQWMKLHNDAIIVTDIKENNVMGVELLAQKVPELKDRFWIQIYGKQEYDTISELGFKNIILTVYSMSWEEKQNAEKLVEFAEKHLLIGITFPIELLELIPDYLKTLKKAKVPLFVHTVNDTEIQRELFTAGVSGIYTDYGNLKK